MATNILSEEVELSISLGLVSFESFVARKLDSRARDGLYVDATEQLGGELVVHLAVVFFDLLLLVRSQGLLRLGLNDCLGSGFGLGLGS